jgi:hypothetical protein
MLVRVASLKLAAFGKFRRFLDEANDSGTLTNEVR